MGKVIKFPQRDVLLDGMKQCAIDICNECGLTAEEADSVFDDYEEFHDKLFSTFSVTFSTEGVTFTEAQVEAVEKANHEAMSKVSTFHLEQMIQAAGIIIGLLAREQMARK